MQGIEPNYNFYSQIKVASTVMETLSGLEKMIQNKWYNIKSQDKINRIKKLIDSGLCDDVEFNHNFTKVRTIGFELINLKHVIKHKEKKKPINFWNKDKLS